MHGELDCCCVSHSKFYHFGLIPVYSLGAAAYSTAGLLDDEWIGRRAKRSEHRQTKTRCCLRLRSSLNFLDTWPRVLKSSISPRHSEFEISAQIAIPLTSLSVILQTPIEIWAQLSMRNHALYQEAIVPRDEDTALPCSDLSLYEARATEVP